MLSERHFHSADKQNSWIPQASGYIKLDSVISDILGVSGRRMIEAMIEGVRSPGKLAELADRRMDANRHGATADHPPRVRLAHRLVG